MKNKRKPIGLTDRKLIFHKTGGLCHFCGEKLVFDAKPGEKGRWNIDHIFPFSYGGGDHLDNYLPICRVCNRLKWNFEGKKIRELLRYGVIACNQVKKRTNLGSAIQDFYNKKSELNKKRRKRNLPDSYYK